MINICNTDNKNNLNEIKIALEQCKLGNDALIIKNALKIFTLKEWEVFFKNKVNLSNDSRQFNLQNLLEEETWWSIIYDKKRDFAYTHSKTRQPLHNDNAWFSDPAEMVFLALEKQAGSGGESTIYLVDRILHDLEKEEKELLNDLQNTEVTITKDASGKYFNKTTIIRENMIFWNYYRTIKNDSVIKSMCDTFFKYLENKESTPSVEVHRCETYDMLCFNDTRLLHGRLAFNAKNKGDRIMHQSMWHINE
tara:strand:- start:12 stop:764 length:753 start_codon:yes stop_codon:yes gene_type:complete